LPIPLMPPGLALALVKPDVYIVTHPVTHHIRRDQAAGLAAVAAGFGYLAVAHKTVTLVTRRNPEALHQKSPIINNIYISVTVVTLVTRTHTPHTRAHARAFVSFVHTVTGVTRVTSLICGDFAVTVA